MFGLSLQSFCKHCTAIRRDTQASRQPLSAIFKHCTSHWAQYPSLVPAIENNIQALRHYQAQYPSFAPAIGRNIQSSRHYQARYPSFAPAIRCDIQASCCQHRARHLCCQPSEEKPKHCTAIGCKIKASRWLIDVTGKPARHVLLRRCISVAGMLP